MALDSYEGLKTSIESFVDRELVDSIDDFIDLAEERHRSDIRLRDQLARCTFTVNSRYADLPSNFLSARTMRLMTDPITPLAHVEQERMDRIRTESEGRPTSYALAERIEFDTEPDQNYQGEILYYKKVQPLGADNPSNVILEASGAVYLWGALAATSLWLMHDERTQLWESQYQAAVDRLNQLDQRKVGTPIARVPMRAVP